jgi:hypothetical protein
MEGDSQDSASRITAKPVAGRETREKPLIYLAFRVTLAVPGGKLRRKVESPRGSRQSGQEVQMAGLVSRVKNILLNPKEEWHVIDGEPGDTKEVFTYVAILAAIPAVFGILGGLILLPGAFTILLVSAILGYLIAFAVVYLIAFIIDALAPTFGTEKHFPSALKLTAYAYTPSWVAGVFSIIPVLGGILALLAGLYGLYLLYLGLPILMRAPQEKVVGYLVVIVICAIVVSLVLGFIVAAVAGGLALTAIR